MKKLELTSFQIKTGDLVFERTVQAVRHDDESDEFLIERIQAWLHLNYPESNILSIVILPTIDCQRFRMNQVSRKGFLKLYGTADPFELAKLTDEELIQVGMFGIKGCQDLRRFVDQFTQKIEIGEQDVATTK